MDTLSIVLSLLLATLTLYLLVRLPLAILGNLRSGQQFHQALAATLQQLRLTRMLGLLGIDKTAYLYRQSALEVRQHMARCDDCDAKPACDQALEKTPPATTEALGFCPNIQDLKAIRDRD